MYCGAVLDDTTKVAINGGLRKTCKCKKQAKVDTKDLIHNFTVYSDLHDDAQASNAARIDEHMRIRANLPRSHFIALGDIGNWVLPSDSKRFVASTPKKKLLGIDDYIDTHVNDQVEKYKRYPWRFLGMGNHCYSVLKYHHTNPLARLARKLNVPYGGISGMARFRFFDKTSKGPRNSFTMLYHHGAWGGRVVKGFGGARDYARHFDDWDLFVYGHNHHCNVHKEARISMTAKGKLYQRDIHFVNTGTFYDGLLSEDMSYAEVHGYGPVSLAAPLISVIPALHSSREESPRVNISVSTGDF